MRMYFKKLNENESFARSADVPPGNDWLPIVGDYAPGMTLVPGEQDGEPVLFAREREKSVDELAFEADAAVRVEIARTYSLSDELKLMNAAIEALAVGYKLPQEYEDYRAVVAAAKEKAP